MCVERLLVCCVWLFFLNVFKMEGMSGGFCLLYQDVQDVFFTDGERVVSFARALHEGPFCETNGPHCPSLS